MNLKSTSSQMATKAFSSLSESSGVLAERDLREAPAKDIRLFQGQRRSQHILKDT
ncbi:MAG TPA: hypothetical protein VFC84_14360 [Desulfosporosinus sp.]|nr:hypothetical protein [Desulfosporosinus sp.]